MRQETRQNLVLRLSLSAEKQNGDKGRHYRALLTYWINTFFENQCCRPERFRRYSDGPNIAGALGGIVNSVAGANQGALEIQRVNSITLQATAGGFGGGTLSLNASKISSLYQAIDEVRVNALFGLNLIKAF